MIESVQKVCGRFQRHYTTNCHTLHEVVFQETVFFSEAVHEVMLGAPEYRDGYLIPSEQPGLGVDLNEEAAAKHPYKRSYLPTVRRADGSVHDW